MTHTLSECFSGKDYGSPDSNGYPRAQLAGKRKRLSRWVWEFANQASILPGYVVMHLCDNPDCIKAEHLQVGTASENMQDMWNKGRHAPPARKDHCKRCGQLRTAENTYTRPGTSHRSCRLCHEAWKAARKLER